MFIDKTYFEGEIYLPINNRNTLQGVDALAAGTSQGNLDYFITVYEDEYLRKLLGKVYPVYMDEIITDVYSERAQALYHKIYSNISVNKGDKIITYKFSPAAYYIYYFFMSFNRSQTSYKGEVRANVFEAENLGLSASQKLSDIYNRMVDMSIDIQRWICDTHLFDDVIHHHPNEKPVRTPYVYHIMRHRFCFCEFHHINAFGI